MKQLFLGVSDDALLSLFRAAYPEDKAKAMADTLRTRYGSLASILKISLALLEEDIGKEAALYLRLSLSLYIRSVTDRLKSGDTVTEAVLARHFSALYADAAEETVYAVLVDKEDRLLSVSRVAIGSADASSLQPRQVLELAVRAKANGVFLTHNHPGGTLIPSASDKKITDAVMAALSTARIRFLGHYIFADADFVRIGEKNGAADASQNFKEIR